MNELSDRINDLVVSSGLSTRKFSEKIKIPYTTLRNMLVYGKDPYAKNLYLIARYFNVSMEWLLTGKVNENSNKQNRRRYDQEPKMCKIIAAVYEMIDSCECDGSNNK